jgi:hypothetical protein
VSDWPLGRGRLGWYGGASAKWEPMLGNENGHCDKDGKDKDQGRRPDATPSGGKVSRIVWLRHKVTGGGFTADLRLTIPPAGASTSDSVCSRAELAVQRQSAEDLTGVLGTTPRWASPVDLIGSILKPQSEIEYFLPCARKATLARNIP